MSGRRAVRQYGHQVVCLEAASPLDQSSGHRRLAYIPAPRCKSGLKLNKSLPWCLVTPENASDHHSHFFSHFFRFRPADNAGSTSTTTRSSSSRYQPQRRCLSSGRASGSDRRVEALGSAAGRLLKAFAIQVELLRRLRHGTGQYVRVEHVHIHEGGQAVIGNVRAREGDRGMPSST